MNKKGIKLLYIIPSLMVVLSSFGLLGTLSLHSRLFQANDFEKREMNLKKLKKNKSRVSKETFIKLFETDLKADRCMSQSCGALIYMLQIACAAVLFFTLLNIGSIIIITHKKKEP